MRKTGFKVSRYAASCIAILFCCGLSACVYVPVVDTRQTDTSNCKTFTQSLSLNAVEVRGYFDLSHGCRNEECVAVLGTAMTISAGSAIISGSIVLTGNTLHWLEYQGTCSDGYLNKTKQLFLDSVNKIKPENS